MRRNLRVFNANLRLVVVLLSGCLACLCDGQVYTYPSGYVYDAGAASGLTARQQRRNRNSRPSSRNGGYESAVSNRRSSRYQSSQEQTGYQNSQIQYTSNPYSQTQNSQSQTSPRDYSQYSSNRISPSTSSSSQYYTGAGQYSTMNNQRTSVSNTRTSSRSQYESYSSRNGPRPFSQQTQPTVSTSSHTTASLRPQQQPSYQQPSSSSSSAYSSSSRYPTTAQTAQSQTATPTTYGSNVRVEQTPGSVDNDVSESTDQQVRDPYVPYRPRNSTLNRTSPSDQSQEASIGVIEIEQRENSCNVGVIGSTATCED